MMFLQKLRLKAIWLWGFFLFNYQNQDWCATHISIKFYLEAAKENNCQ